MIFKGGTRSIFSMLCRDDDNNDDDTDDGGGDGEIDHLTKINGGSNIYV